MSNFTSINSSNTKKSGEMKFSKFLFLLATIIFLICGLIIGYPIAKVFVFFFVGLAIIFYVFIVIFTLGLVLINDSFREFLPNVSSITSSDEFMEYYPQLTYYCFYALMVVIILYSLSLWIISKRKKANYSYSYSLYATNILMLMLSILTFIILCFLKFIF